MMHALVKFMDHVFHTFILWYFRESEQAKVITKVEKRNGEMTKRKKYE